MGHIYVPMSSDHCTSFFSKVHHTLYSAHSRVKKMHIDLKQLYFWVGMRHDVSDFVARFLECQRVKVEHQHLVGLLHPHTILEWKWDMISIDFIIGFPIFFKWHDCVMLNMDKLSKIAHFTPMKASSTTSSIEHVFLEEIVLLHGIPRQIILDRDPMFTSALWTSL